MNKPVSEARAPDFYHYDANPLSSAVYEGDFVHLRWPDDTTLACHRYWLRENSMGQGGIDIATREGLLDPAHLTDDMIVSSAVVDDAGDLIVEWADDAQRSVYHAGWLYHVADNQHRPNSWLPDARAWTSESIGQVPRVNGSAALEDDDAILSLLNHLVTHGACVLENSPTREGYLLELAQRIGPVRDSNFGALWDVLADVALAGDAKTNSTANTGLRLGPHSDLPTREIPPGFQILHCLVNEAEGGEFRWMYGTGTGFKEAAVVIGTWGDDYTRPKSLGSRACQRCSDAVSGGRVERDGFARDVITTASDFSSDAQTDSINDAPNHVFGSVRVDRPNAGQAAKNSRAHHPGVTNP